MEVRVTVMLVLMSVGRVKDITCESVMLPVMGSCMSVFTLKEVKLVHLGTYVQNFFVTFRISEQSCSYD